MTLAARYSGTCPECGGTWQPGDLIRAREDERRIPDDQSVLKVAVWQHASCPGDELDALVHDHPVCQTCWLSHPNGACDR